MCSGLVGVLVQVETFVLFFDIPLSETVLGSTVGNGTMAGGEEGEGTEVEEVEEVEEEVEGGTTGGEDIDPTIRREPTVLGNEAQADHVQRGRQGIQRCTQCTADPDTPGKGHQID